MVTTERPAAGRSTAPEPWEPWARATAAVSSDTGRSELDSFVANLLGAAESSVVGPSYSASRRSILRHLERGGGSTVASLARVCGASAAHAERLVHDLEQDGLVERYHSDREGHYSITTDGVAALTATRTLQLDLITDLLGSLASGDYARAGDAYRRLRAALDSHSAG